MTDAAIRIVKVGGPPTPQSAATRTAAPRPVRKTMRTYPRSILKKTGGAKGIKPVRDPAKPPPMAPGRKSTVRILTEKGAAKRRETIHKKVKTMPIGAVRETLRRSGLHVKESTPAHIAKEILEGGMEAGMIVSK